MKILGLVGSYRKLGNTEVLIREALMSAAEMGAEVEMLRLTDLNIKPCKGCMACVFKKADCKIEDDANFLFSKLFEADGIILGSPIYIFGPAGIIKMIQDRFLQNLGEKAPDFSRGDESPESLFESMVYK